MLGSVLGSHPNAVATPESKFIVPAYWASMPQPGAAPNVEAILLKLRRDWRARVWGIDFPTSLEIAVSGRDHRSVFIDVVEELVGRYAASVGKADFDVWVDHTPSNSPNAGGLRALYPEAKFINIVRDGRAVSNSVMRLDWGPNTSSRAARWWANSVGEGFAASYVFAEDGLTVRYENIVRELESSINDIGRFVGFDFVPEMLDVAGFVVPEYTLQQHHLVGSAPVKDRIDAWRNELRPRDIEIIESLAGDLLTGLGYELVSELPLKPRTVAEKARHRAVESWRNNITNRADRRRRQREFVPPPGGH